MILPALPRESDLHENIRIERKMFMKDLKIARFTRTALLTAVIFVLSFTPIGYLKVGPFDITFLTIPVIIGAITMGPLTGAFLGAVFGLTSYMQAVTGASPLGGILFSINPFLSAVLCFIPRILMGWLCGLLYCALNRHKNDSVVSVCISSIAGALMNTLFFMSAFMLLFGHTEYVLNLRGGANVLVFLGTMVGVNGLVEAVSCAVIGTAISKPLLIALKRDRGV